MNNKQTKTKTKQNGKIEENVDKKKKKKTFCCLFKDLYCNRSVVFFCFWSIVYSEISGQEYFF